METVHQPPDDPAFVQDPYPFYDRARSTGDIVAWADYGLPVATSHAAVTALLRDRRLGRAQPTETRRAPPPHLAAFHAVEDRSLLELDPPHHTRVRASVLRAFTTRRIASLAPEIEALAHRLLDAAPQAPFDLLDAYARHLPVIIIARLIGVPEAMAPQLLAWSSAFVAMYRPGRTRHDEDAAAAAAGAFGDYLAGLMHDRRRVPRDDLISALVTAEVPLCDADVAATCILLLNAGHEATVHSIGNAVAALARADAATPRDDAAVEEVLRYDPPLHFFSRWVLEDVSLYDHTFRRGDRIGLLLASAGRDPAVYDDPHRFEPSRWPGAPMHAAFGGGLHFCLGAALARMELRIGLDVLHCRLPQLRLAQPPHYAPIYHFHGLDRLMVDPGRPA